MKMKLFASFSMNKAELETSVNAWLEQNADVKIVDIRQSCYSSFWGASPLFITVWYEPCKHDKNR